MDLLEELREEYDQMNMQDNTAIVDAKLTEHSELPLIDTDTKNRLQNLEAQLRIVTIDEQKNILNIYKNLLKVKWIRTEDERFIENIIFNDKTGHLNLVKLEAADPQRTDKLWHEMSRACDNMHP